MTAPESPMPADPPRPVAPAVLFDNIPPAMKDVPQWVCWWYEPRTGKNGAVTWTKVPLDPNRRDDEGRPVHASSTDPKTWGTIEQARAAYMIHKAVDGVAGVGFVLTPPFVGVDYDKCVDPDGSIEPRRRAWLEKLHTYAEISPSLTGVKAYLLGTLPADCKHKSTPLKIEFYGEARFFTVTGHRVEFCPPTVEARQAELMAVHAEVIPPERPKPKPIPATAMTPANLPDRVIFDKAMAAVNGSDFGRLWTGDDDRHNGDASAGDLALCNHLAFWTQGNAGQMDGMFRSSGRMRPKWDERHSGDGRTYGQMTIDKAVGDCRTFYDPNRGRSNGNCKAHDDQPAPPRESMDPPDSEDGPPIEALMESAEASGAMPDVADPATRQAWKPKPEFVVENTEPMRLAEHYLKHRWTLRGELTLRRYRQEFWGFDHGGYRTLEEEVAAADVYRHLDRLWQVVERDEETKKPIKFKKLVARSSLVAEVSKAVAACGALVEGEMPQWLDGRASPRPADVIAFRNGLMDTTTLRGDATVDTGAPLIPLTPLWFGGQACPFEFDPKAACPSWLTALDQCLIGDMSSMALLQEWFGLNCIPDNRFEKFMLLVGKPRGGKGTALHALAAMLGERQVATTSFTKLASRFGLDPLVGKLAAIMPDAHITARTDAKAAMEILKSVTGNDAQAIDRKGIKELPNVRLFCRFTIAVNDLPELPDEAGALKSRLLLVHFPNTYSGREDTGLKAKISAEAPGIALWALEGLRRLRTQGRFTVPDRSAAMTAEFEKIISPVLGFLDDRCEVALGDDGVWVEKDELYAAWCDWSKDRGTEAGSKAKFGQSIINAGKGIVAGKKGPTGQQFPVYKWVRLCS